VAVEVSLAKSLESFDYSGGVCAESLSKARAGTLHDAVAAQQHEQCLSAQVRALRYQGTPHGSSALKGLAVDLVARPSRESVAREVVQRVARREWKIEGRGVEQAAEVNRDVTGHGCEHRGVAHVARTGGLLLDEEDQRLGTTRRRTRSGKVH